MKGLEFDERTLALLDTDGDGRVRAPELVAAATWLKDLLADPKGLVDGKDGVPLAAIRTSTPEGQAVLASARHMLAVLGKSDSPVITVDDVAQATALAARAPRNGDGVVRPDAMPDEDAVAKRAAAADDEAYAMPQTSTATAASGAPPPPPEKPKLDVGVVAALGVAVGGITAALGALLQAFFGLGLLMPIGVVGAMALVSGPAMFLAWLKLRQRNIGPILDANGWAVNALTTVNIPLGRSLTTLASLPPGSSRSLVDPFAPERSAWRPVAALLVVVLFALGAWKAGVLAWPEVP